MATLRPSRTTDSSERPLGRGRNRLRTLGGLALPGVPPGHRKALLLLTYLALEGPQPRGHLARLFWPGSRDARNRLSVALSRLRAAAPGSFTADDHLVATTLATDADVLRRALDRGRARLALRLYAGPFLAGVDDGAWGEELAEWVVNRRDAIALELQRACVRSATADAATGRFEAAATLAGAVQRVAGTALLDPEDLRSLHAVLVAGDRPEADGVRRDAAALGLTVAKDRAEARATLLAGGTGPRPRHNLRRAATSFFGREAERLELGRVLADPSRHLVTLVGPGGIGKTRLATQVAADLLDRGHFPGGVWFVPLNHVGDGAMGDAVAEVLGAPPPAEADPEAHLMGLLAGAPTLLVLDDLDHLTAVGPRLAAWLGDCPGLTLLATSRQPLELTSEWVVPVHGLAVPSDPADADEPAAWSAIALFEERGRQVDPNFRVRPADARHVFEIARLTGGSPLALELAAAWVATMPLAAIAEEVARDRDFLTSTQHDRVDRHRSLRAVFEHSWRLLTAPERACLAALAVFRGGFDRAAALAVASANATILARLAARSLIMRTDDDRFVRHPLIHQYTEEKLDADPVAARTTRARHAAHLLTVAEDTVVRLGREPTGAALERLEADHANLRAALAWADAAGDRRTLLRLASALVSFWVWLGHHREALEWFARAAAHGPDDADPSAYARAQLRFAFVCLGQQRFDLAAPQIEDALERFRALGDRAGEARALSHRGMLAVFQGDFTAARPQYLRALALARAAEDDDAVGRILNNLGDSYAYALEPVAARAAYEESLAFVRRLGDRQMTSNVLGSLGLVALEAGDRAAAGAAVAESAALVRALGIAYSVPTALDQLACLAAADGHGERAARLWGAAAAARAALEVPDPVFTDAQLAPWRARARAEVGAAAFDRAWSVGREMRRAAALTLVDAEVAAVRALQVSATQVSATQVPTP